jgi:hypothetical protein
LRSPGPPEGVAVAAELVDEFAVVVVESFGSGSERVAGLAPFTDIDRTALGSSGLGVDGVDSLVGGPDQMERVEADVGLVHRDGLDLGAAVGSELFEEAVECGLAASDGNVEDPAGVVAGDDGQILMTPFVRDFVDTEVEDPVEAAVVEVFGDDSHHHHLDGLP